jgi:Mce-associated membrane protein
MDAARTDAREVSTVDAATDQHDAGPAAVGRSRGWWVRVVLALLLPVLVAAGLFVWQDGERDAAAASAAEDRAALNAATLQTLNWASVDYRDVDSFVAKVQAGATGDFAQQFDESEDALRELIESNESVQVPTIPNGGAGLLERRDDQARVLIVMDAQVTNTSAKTPQPRQYRLQVTVSKVEGRWLTSQLEFIDEQA